MKILGLEIELFHHASVMIKSSKILYFDPFQISENLGVEKADIVFITHSHYDHCSPEDVKLVSDDNTIVVTVAGCKEKLSDVNVKEIRIIKVNESIEVEGIKITAVPAYNINKSFHPKANEWVGFIVEIDGKKIYHAGDTDLIPEMKKIDVDIAFLPVGGTYTMNAEEAAQATKEFKRCEIAIPMHYGAIVGSAGDAKIFTEKAGCKVIKLI